MNQIEKDKVIYNIARVCHEANRAYCVSIGDNSQSQFEIASGWQVESACKGVCFHLNNPNASPSASHDSWLKQKEETGWKYGPVKDAIKKEHPCFVPFNELPLEQQVKDHLFKSIVNILGPLLIK